LGGIRLVAGLRRHPLVHLRARPRRRGARRRPAGLPAGGPAAAGRQRFAAGGRLRGRPRLPACARRRGHGRVRLLGGLGAASPGQRGAHGEWASAPWRGGCRGPV
ncbi:unnamed protein product, partial [Prorocentrum cordatum]